MPTGRLRGRVPRRSANGAGARSPIPTAQPTRANGRRRDRRHRAARPMPTACLRGRIRRTPNHGQGVITYARRLPLRGRMARRASGTAQGTATYPDGTVYEGTFPTASATGRAASSMPDGFTYEANGQGEDLRPRRGHLYQWRCLRGHVPARQAAGRGHDALCQRRGGHRRRTGPTGAPLGPPTSARTEEYRWPPSSRAPGPVISAPRVAGSASDRRSTFRLQPPQQSVASRRTVARPRPSGPMCGTSAPCADCARTARGGGQGSAQ